MKSPIKFKDEFYPFKDILNYGYGLSLMYDYMKDPTTIGLVIMIVMGFFVVLCSCCEIRKDKGGM